MRILWADLIGDTSIDTTLIAQSTVADTAIRAAVVEVQSGVAEHEWDIAEAYQALMLELDRRPIDADRVLEHVDAALMAENQVKKKQVNMLIRLKNLLTVAQQLSEVDSLSWSYCGCTDSR